MEVSKEMKISAWIGAGFMIVSAALYVYVAFLIDHTLDPIHPTMDFSFVVPMPFAVIAILLMLIGGLSSRPKYFWLVSLLSGLFCFVVFYPIMEGLIQNYQHTEPAYRHLDSHDILEISISILPGLLLLIESIVLFLKRNIPRNTD